MSFPGDQHFPLLALTLSCVAFSKDRKKKKTKKKLYPALCPVQTKANSGVLFPGVLYGVGSTVVMISWWFGTAVMIFMVLRGNNLDQTLPHTPPNSNSPPHARRTFPNTPYQRPHVMP
jgi:hypothetical protein